MTDKEREDAEIVLRGVYRLGKIDGINMALKQPLKGEDLAVASGLLFLTKLVGVK